MSAVLGIAYGHHEASACAYSSNGEVLYLREEWLSRVKNDPRFPALSIRWLLDYVGPDEVVAIGHFQKPMRNWLLSGLEKGLSNENYLLKLRQFKTSDLRVKLEIKKAFKKSSRPPLYFCPHHLSHVLGTRLFHNKSGSRILHVVLDGYGDGLSGGVWLEANEDIQIVHQVPKSSSLGLIYSALTEWAGFNVNEDEFKIMALSAYGEPTYLKVILENYIFVENGSLIVKGNLFNFNDVGQNAISPAFERIFGTPREVDQNKAHQNKTLVDVICSFQRALEHVVIQFIAEWAHRYAHVEKITLSGGVFHNSVLAGKIEEQEFGAEVLLPPSPGDAGSSLGAAVFAALSTGLSEFAQKSKYDENPYLGPALPPLTNFPALFGQVRESPMLFVKKLLNEGATFACYTGKAEIGPRALCSRSLLCDGRNPEAIRVLNHKIKNREEFRPVAITLSSEVAEKIFFKKNFSPATSWMGSVLKLKDKIENFPFAHADNTTRPQIVDLQKENFLGSKIIYQLLKENYILGNTSLNISGDPMVFSPEDLYINCRRMGIQYVINYDNIYKILL
jgi:carbamoyltransferase